MSDAILVDHLSRVFNGRRRGDLVVALDNVSIDVKEGEIFGLLGPNGAGKTTLIKILATLLLPTSGEARVLGYDVTTEARKIRPLINLVGGGEISGYGLLTVRENLWMFSQFYGIPSKEAKRRIDTLLEVFGMRERANAKVRTLSTGEKQKMNVIRGFVTNPSLIFLDEPTLGLDVNYSRVIRQFVRNWIRETSGRTVLLTTHYMHEAEELCDRVAIIDRGRIIACDTPSNLKKRLKGAVPYHIVTSRFPHPEALKSINGVSGTVIDEGEEFSIRLTVDDEAAVADVISYIVSSGGKILSMSKMEPTLEDVFIHMVGRGLE